MDKQHEILARHPGANHKDISKLVGEMWRAAPEHVKEHYRKRAEQGRKMHMMQYPDYKYSSTQRRKETAAKKKGLGGIVNNVDDCVSNAGSPAGSGACSPALTDGREKTLDPVVLGNRLESMMDPMENDSDLPTPPPLVAANPTPPQELAHPSDFSIFTAWRDGATDNNLRTQTDALSNIFAADADESNGKNDLKIIVDEPFNVSFTESLFGDSPFSITSSSNTSTPMCLSPATLKTLEFLTEPFPIPTTQPAATDSKLRDVFLPTPPRNHASSAPSPLRPGARFPRLNTQTAITSNDLDDLAEKFWSLPSPGVDAFWGVGCGSGLTPRTPRTPGTGLRGMFMLPSPSEV